MTKYLLAATLLTATLLPAQEGPTRTQTLIALDSKSPQTPTPQNITIKDYLSKHFGITDVRKFFLDELSYYASRPSLEFDDIEKVK